MKHSSALMRICQPLMLSFLLVSLSSLFSGSASGSPYPDPQIREVPAAYPTIQSAIQASTDGDTVLVAPGEYFENINLRGKNIVLASHFLTTGETRYQSETIINGSRPMHPDTASCILIVSGETAGCVVTGFTITGGISAVNNTPATSNQQLM